MNATPNPALSYAAGPTDQPLLDVTIGDHLDLTVSRFPDREALVDVPSGRRWTYRQLKDDVDALASALIDDGIEQGDRVGIWAPNYPEWVLVQHATAKIGAILVTINPAYRTSELEYALNKAGIRTLFAVESFKTSNYSDMVAEVAERCPALRRSVYFGTPEWDALLERGRSLPPEPRQTRQAGLRPDDPINIQYTSGTTGFPKGATLSHRNILNNGYFVGSLVGYSEIDRICAPVPFYHCFGMVMSNLAAVAHGACVVIPSPAFDPRAALEAAANERCTSQYGVPTMFIAMLSQPDFDSYDLSAMRTGIMAGSPCPVEVMKQITAWAPEVAICYGMTETSPASTQTLPHDSLEARVSTVGRVHPHVEAKVIDPDTGEVVARGTAGELCNRGYSVMLGYWDDPEKTAEAIDTDGWIHTGDLAVMDDDGFIAITGRIKDMVLRGGECIYPREIEEFLYTHPDILDAQVIGVPDATYGEELMVWVRLRNGAPTMDAGSLKDFASGKLARYKIPRYVYVVDEFPMTVTGKIRKVEMREHSVEMLGLTTAS
ncbi:AMP-binding protein [Nocardioides zeicaulis]|uniref:AMP-binding protein n=1 Tax=Nocardioides zeicaulis TaxID=1776857 RepID=A0ABV6DWN9_9ACTN